jgi:hypothetical protein
MSTQSFDDAARQAVREAVASGVVERDRIVEFRVNSDAVVRRRGPPIAIGAR